MAAVPRDASPGRALSLGTMGRCEGSWLWSNPRSWEGTGGETVQRFAEQARE